MAILEYLKRVFPGTAEGICRKSPAGHAFRGKAVYCYGKPRDHHACGKREEIRELLLSKQTAITPDGISVVKAMRMCGLPAKERITGVDLAEKLLKKPGKPENPFFCWGRRKRWFPLWLKS